MLIRLNKIKVFSLSGGKSVVSIELKLGINNGLISTVIRVISPSVNIGSNIGIRLNNPDKFLTRVVKRELALNGSVRE
jgi:hypothetical protein